MKLWFLKLKEKLLCRLGRHDWAWYEGLSFRDGVYQRCRRCKGINHRTW
jgi:hypothetical protein